MAAMHWLVILILVCMETFFFLLIRIKVRPTGFYLPIKTKSGGGTYALKKMFYYSK